MSDLKLLEKVADKVLDITDEHAGKIVDNIADKPAEALGTNITSLLSLVFSPFRYLNEKSNIYFAHKLETYKKELEEKEKSIPAEKRIKPDFHTVSLALDNSKFCITNDDLRHMFVNLIVSAMNSDTANSVHPSFAEMIKQMSSTDARVLASFSKEPVQPLLEIHLITDSSSSSFATVQTNLFLMKESSDPLFDKTDIAITNLNRLGLLEIDYTTIIGEESKYSDLVRIVDDIMRKQMPSKKFEYIRGIASLTPLGEEFIQICLSD